MNANLCKFCRAPLGESPNDGIDECAACLAADRAEYSGVDWRDREPECDRQEDHTA